MAEHPLKIFEKVDPELLRLVQTTNAFALADGALPRKIKFLMAMALGAAHGTVEGTKALADQAMKQGQPEKRLLRR